MQVNYALNTNELDNDFLQAIKLMFKNKNIIISISDEEAEDNALACAIEQGLNSETVSKDVLTDLLYAD